MEMISREKAIEAVKALCMSDTPQMIWSSDALDAIKKQPTLISAFTDDKNLVLILPKSGEVG